jgi:hypothetical protein
MLMCKKWGRNYEMKLRLKVSGRPASSIPLYPMRIHRISEPRGQMKAYDEEASRGKPVNPYDTLLYPEIVERRPKSTSKRDFWSILTDWLVGSRQ